MILWSLLKRSQYVNEILIFTVFKIYSIRESDEKFFIFSIQVKYCQIELWVKTHYARRGLLHNGFKVCQKAIWYQLDCGGCNPANSFDAQGKSISIENKFK